MAKPQAKPIPDDAKPARAASRLEPPSPWPPPEPVREAVPTPAQALHREARAILGDRAHPEELAAYMISGSILRLAEEIAATRKLLESGEGAITVGMDTSGGS